MLRTANAVWHGTGKDGSGTLDTQSGVLKAHPYSYHTRFVDEEGRAGTNPEELIGAAHAGCFTMALAFALEKAGNPADELRTQANVTFGPVDGKPTVSKIALVVDAHVPGLTPEQVREHAEQAKADCPISRLLNAEITLEVRAK